MTDSSFLKKLLATASIVAVTANAGHALANDARVTKGTPATQAGANFEQNKVGGGAAANVAVNAGSTIVFRGAHTYQSGGAAVNLAAVKVDGNFIAAIDAIAGGGAGANFTLGSVIRDNGSTGLVNISLNNGTEITLTGAGATEKGYIANLDATTAPGNNANWAFSASDNNYTGLGVVTFNHNNDKLIINSGAQLDKAIRTNAGGNGIIEVNSSNIIFGAGIIGGVGKLDIKDEKAATLRKTSDVQVVEIGNGSSLAVADNITITSDNIKGSLADKGTLKFEGKATVNAVKIGHAAKLNAVELVGAGTVNFALTTNFDATKTTLSHNDAVLQFSKANLVETDIMTATDGKGKVVISEDIALKGNIGENNKSLAEINFSANKTLLFEKGGAKLYAGNVTTNTPDTGKLDIKSVNFEIHSNIGAKGKELNVMQIYQDVAGNAATTVKLMNGKSIYATSVDLSKTAAQNTLELHEGSSITGNIIATTANTGSLSVKGDSKIYGTIGVGPAIDKIQFDAAKTLEVTKNTLSISNNGINFAEDGTLKLTENLGVNFDKAITTKVVEGGAGSIIIDSAVGGKTIDLQVQIGDVTKADNTLKLLQVKGGADIQFSHANIAIKKVDITSQDSKLTLNVANGKFLIGDYTHEAGKGTLHLADDATLKAGTKLSADENNTLKSINLGANKTLILEDGVNLYTTNDINGGIRSNALGDGKLIIQGNSTIGAVVGATAIGDIDVTGKGTATFLNKVSLSAAGAGNGALTISNGATAVLGSEFVGAHIQGANAGEGTVKFTNNVALENANKIAAEIGNTQLNIVELAGKDITFTHAGGFDTQNLKFSNTGNTTATFTGFAGGNELQNTIITTTSTNREHNIVLTKVVNYVLDKNVGTDQNRFGNFVLTGDGAITTNGIFYAGVVNSNGQEGVVTLNNNGNVALNLGRAGSELKSVNINGSTTVYEGVWSKNLTVGVGATATFKDSISGTGALTLNNNSIVNFDGQGKDLNIAVYAGAPGQGTISFSSSAKINANIGATAQGLNSVDFVGTKTTDIADINTNIFANNINVGAQTIRATKNVTLDGATLFANGSVLDLGTNKVILQNGNSRVVGATGVNITLNGDKKTGSMVVDAAGGVADLNTAGATKITVNVNDSFAALPSEDETYNTIFTVANGGTIAPIEANIIDAKSVGNNFVNWSFDNNNKTFVRKNVASKFLESVLGASDKELLRDALQFVDSKNQGKSASYAADLSRMDSGKLKESLERSSEQTTIHATTIANNLLKSTNAAIDNRMRSFSNSDVSGKSSGEDYTMYGAWLSPFYNQTTQKANGSRAGFKSSSYGATLGFDTQANADLTVGVAGTYTKSDAKHKNFKSGDKTKGDTFAFSVYSTQQLSNNWFLQGHAGYATTRVKNSEKRITSLTSEIAKSDYDLTSYNVELLGGFDYRMGEAVITPLVGANYTRINSSGYTESGATNQDLTVSSKATNKLNAIAGLRGHMTTEMDGITITPEMHGFVRHDLVGKDAKTTAKLSGMANSLAPKSAKVIKTTFNVGLGVNAVSGMYEYGAGYDLFAANKAMGHQGTLKVRINF